MPSGIKHSDINAELIRKYYNGSLTEAEKNAIEKLALDDPFLKDALDGFDQDPGAFEAFYKNRLPAKTTGGSFQIVIGLALTAILVAILIVLHSKKEDILQPQTIASSDVSNIDTSLHEIEILPTFIDTLSPAPETDQIRLEEIAQDREEIEKSILYDQVQTDVPILIKEEDLLADDYVLEPEEHNLEVQELVPATYLFGMFVVDYRRIKRENTQITYTKYELTGTSAEFENEHAEQNQDLQETTVEISYWEYLGKALEAFSNENYKSALNRFEIILSQYTEDFNALFYGGLCFYNLGNFNKALSRFDQIISIELNAFKEEAYWYKSKCLIKLGRKAEARDVLDFIIANGGFYVSEAIALRKKL